jgi:hypothetical protein
VAYFHHFRVFQQTPQAPGQGCLADLRRRTGNDDHFHGSRDPSHLTSLKTSQLARTDANAVLVAYPADIPERYAMLTVNLKGPDADKGLPAVHLDGRANDEFSHRIPVHVSTSIPWDCPTHPIVVSSETRGKSPSQIVARVRGRLVPTIRRKSTKKAMRTGWLDPSYSHPV